MLVTLNHPYKDMYGGIGTHLYIRRSPSGKFIIQRKPRKASKKQQDMRKKFGQIFGTARHLRTIS